MSEAALLAPRLPPLLQLRTQFLPVLHIARRQDQALLRTQPRRPPRDQPRRAHHHQARRGATPTTGATLAVALAAEAVLPVVLRPGQRRRLAATKQDRPPALRHHLEW